MTEKRQQTIDFELMSGIIERAERMGIARNRTTHFLDLSNAHKAFSPRFRGIFTWKYTRFCP